MTFKHSIILASILAVLNCQSISSNLKKSDGVDILASVKAQLLIKSVPKCTQTLCYVECSFDPECFIMIYIELVCTLFNIDAKDYIVSNPANIGNVYYKMGMLPEGTELAIKSFIQGLIHYWPISKSTVDIIGHKNMTIEANGELVADRLGNPSGALHFTSGYSSVPSSIYFDPATGGFTVMLWMQYFSFPVTWVRLIGFGNGPNSDDFVLTLHDSTNLLLNMALYSGSIMQQSNFNNNFDLDRWYHVAVSVNEGVVRYFTDGESQGSLSNITYNGVERTKCYFGKSSWDNDGTLNGELDEVKIFNRGLSQDEIRTEMNEIRWIFLETN